MTAGSYQPGMEQDATTASASGTRGAPARPNITRCPVSKSTATIQVRPSAQDPGDQPAGPRAGLRWLAKVSRAATVACRASCRPRPRGSQALAPTPGWMVRGARSVVSISRGEPARRWGRGGCGPSSRSRRPASRSAGTGSPRCRAVISSRVIPQRRAAASTLPALVPTIRLTSPTGTGRRSCTACSAPVIQAAPTTPPDPSTTAVRGTGPGSGGHPRAAPDPAALAPWHPRGAHLISPAERSPGCPRSRLLSGKT